MFAMVTYNVTMVVKVTYNVTMVAMVTYNVTMVVMVTYYVGSPESYCEGGFKFLWIGFLKQ